MAQIDELRQWRQNAIESHLYATAELVGDKILAMTGHPDDAYWLAQTYYEMGEYLRGAELILRHVFEQESQKCKYIAALCLIKAQELDRALALLHRETSLASSADISNVGGSSGFVDVHTVPDFAPHFDSAASGAGPLFPAAANIAGGGGSLNSRVRVVSTSSIKAPGTGGIHGLSIHGASTGKKSRSISGGSRVSMILPEFDEDSAHLTGTPGDKEELNGVFVDSLLQFSLGQVYTLQAKFTLAKESYIAALRLDSRCFEALNQLTKYHSLTPKEEWALIKSLDFPSLGDFGRSLYALRLSVLGANEQLEESIENLMDTYQLPETNADILAARGDIAFARSQYKVSRENYELILSEDAHNPRIYANYASTLYELGAKNELYKLAHTLSLASPENAATWYAIGVYYLSTQRTTAARQNFSKSSMLDPGYAPAWLAFARTFAEEAEHEQAMTAYSTAARLFPGYYLPYVHMGMQHLQLGNLGLAEKYLLTAASLFGEDPVMLNELGVVYYNKKEYVTALQTLEMALDTAIKIDSDLATRVSIKSNLGFVLRRMDHIHAALDAFDDVYRHSPLDANILAAMGLCYLQLGNHAQASERLAQALSLDRDDPVADDLMKRAVRASVNDFDIKEFSSAHRRIPHSNRIELDFSNNE